MPLEPFTDLARPQPVDRCAWYLRVSTPKQKLEHQREHVLRYCEHSAIHVPPEFRFEDKEKRHRSAKRQDFQRLLDLVKAQQLDWIIICSFDRWGVADVDEFFEFRRLLLRHDVRLWSVVDQMNLTGITEGDYFRIVAMAIGSTKYVEQMAEKNILKMIEMAKQGWAATGNASYGTDLVCYPLHDLTHPLFRVVRTRYMRPHAYRVLHYSRDSRVERDEAGLIVAQHLTVVKEEATERMPARDKKATGYRFEPSVEAERLRAVNLMFELYDAGMEFREISRSLWEQGYKHYDKPFGYHGVESILQNPVYMGLPAWGKIGVGAYRVLHSGQPARIRRKPSDTYVVRKGEDQYIQPSRPLFPPVVPPDLWQRVHDRLQNRAHTNPHFGKRRTRSRATHPLNGKLVCPDCEQPMVLGSSMPAVGGRGKKTRCFNCGTYRRFSRVKCYANTVGWDRLEAAIQELLETVKGRIDRVTADPAKALREELWARDCELTKVWMVMTNDFVKGIRDGLAEDGPAALDVPLLDQLMEQCNRIHAQRTDSMRQELERLVGELERIGALLLDGIPSQTIKKQLYDRSAVLESRKAEIEAQLVPVTDQARRLRERLHSLRDMIDGVETTETAQLLDTFVEKVVPQFEVTFVGPRRRRRAILRSVRFIPRQTESARSVLPSAVEMEIGATRTGTGSSPPPARTRPGTSSRSVPARSSRGPPPAAGAAPPGCGG
jgi:DNA invertase Pin-like site-specific DNA recombinase